MRAFSVGVIMVIEVTPISIPHFRGAVAAVTGGRLGICDLFSDIPPHQFGIHQFSGTPKMRQYEN